MASYDVCQLVEVQELSLLISGELQLHGASSGQEASQESGQPVLHGPCILEGKEKFGWYFCLRQCKASLPCLTIGSPESWNNYLMLDNIKQ